MTNMSKEMMSRQMGKQMGMSNERGGVVGLVIGPMILVQETRLAVQSLAGEAQLTGHPIEND